MQRSRVNVEVLLRHLGISAKKERGYRKWVGLCPNPAHNDSKPSWSIIDRQGERNHASHHCFSCGFGGGPWELAAAAWGIDIKEAGPRIDQIMLEDAAPAAAPRVVVVNPQRKVFRLPMGVVFPDSEADWYEPAISYLRRRRVTFEQIQRWGIGYAIRGRLKLRVVIPVHTAGRLRTFSARAFVDGIPRYDAGQKYDGAQPDVALLGQNLFDDGDAVTVAEGAFSVLALERAGAPNPCGILSSEVLPGRLLHLQRFRRVYVATDPDKAGDKAYAALRAALGRRAEVIRKRFRFSPDDMPDDELSAAFS